MAWTAAQKAQHPRDPRTGRFVKAGGALAALRGNSDSGSPSASAAKFPKAAARRAGSTDPATVRGIANSLIDAESRDEAMRIAEGLKGKQLQAVADALGTSMPGRTVDEKRTMLVSAATAFDSAAVRYGFDVDGREQFLREFRQRARARVMTNTGASSTRDERAAARQPTPIDVPAAPKPRRTPRRPEQPSGDLVNLSNAGMAAFSDDSAIRARGIELLEQQRRSMQVADIEQRLARAESRDEGFEILKTYRSRAGLETLARHLGMRGLSQYRRVDELKHAIVSLTIGGRLSFAAMRDLGTTPAPSSGASSGSAKVLPFERLARQGRRPGKAKPRY